MKKIKLDSAKLVLKKEIIGNLTNTEMVNVMGGDAYGTGAGMCTDFTKQEGTQCQSDYKGNCTGPFPSYGCPESHACPPPNDTKASCVYTGPTCPLF